MIKNLELTSYEPKFTDPRVRERAISVLNWCEELRLSKRGRPVHHDELTKVFSNHRRGLGQWLFVNLLIQSGQYQSGKQSLTYRVKEHGYEKIHSLLNTQPRSELEVVRQVYDSFIQGVESPEYKDKGGRRYHPIQNIKRDLRKQAFAGWWDYDIESSAPTLVYQYAVQHHRLVYGNDSPPEPFPAVARLVNEKAAVTAEIANLVAVDLQQAKEIRNAIFFRANPAPSSKATLFASLGYDESRLRRLLDDRFIKELRSELKPMWRYAEHHQKRDRFLNWMDKRENARLAANAAKQRMQIYLSLERKVMDAMLSVLTAKNIPVILMHDGFMLKRKINIQELEMAVTNETGFLIRLSESVIGGEKEIDDEPDIVDLMQGDVADDEMQVEISVE